MQNLGYNIHDFCPDVKQNISPLLRSDFGIEDFVAGAHRVDDFALSLEDAALSNQLGLLAPLADRADTGTESFAMAAESYLGESNAIGIMADNVIDNINKRFATAVEISKMGVEGFDAFAYGAEDFVENVKYFFKMIAAAFKKLIQTVTNFCKMVINWVRGQVAKTQTKYYEENKNKINEMTDESKGKLIKVRIPVSDTKSICESFWGPLKKYNETITKTISSAIIDNDYDNSMKGASGSYVVDDSPNWVNLKFKSKKGNVGITAKTKPSEFASYLVFGENKKKEMRPAAFLKAVNVESFLSETALKTMNAFNKEGNELIKDFNKVLKELNNLSKEMFNDAKEKAWNDNNMDADKRADRNNSEYKSKVKEEKKNLKARRKVMRDVSLLRNVGGKLTGILLSTYSNLLTVRSYCVTAIKAYGANSERQKEKDKQRKERRDLLGM